MKLTILLDENVSPAIAGFLKVKRPEWEILHVYDLGLAGASDALVFREAAIASGGNHVRRGLRGYADVPGRHSRRRDPSTVVAYYERGIERALGRLLESTSDEWIPGSLIVIDQQRIRIRRSASHGE